MRAEMEPQVANAHARPDLDETTFQQILAAAFVIQQHNDFRPPVRSTYDPAITLAEIAETQERLRSQPYDLQGAAGLIAQRLTKITNATGTAVALVNEDHLEYCAASGSSSRLNGTSVPIGAPLSDFLREQEAQRHTPGGSRPEVLQYREANSRFFFPVYREGKITGLLQVSFPDTEPIQQHEIRSCQVMAGLMGEAMERAAEVEWKQTVAAERASMLEALERLRPQLERLTSEAQQGAAATEPAATPKESAQRTISAPASQLPEDIAELEAELAAGLAQFTALSTEPEEAKDPFKIAAAIPSSKLAPLASETPTSANQVSATESDVLPSLSCEQCGYPFGETDMFCGKCGTPRTMQLLFPTAPSPHSERESAPQEKVSDSTKVEAPEISAPAQPEFEASPRGPIDVLLPGVLEPTFGPFAEPAVATAGSSALAMERKPAKLDTAQDADQKGKIEIVREVEKAKRPSPWASAIRTRKWLESLQPGNSPAKIWLARHSGDVSIALAAAVLLFALTGWGTQPTRSTVQSKTPPPPSLSLFERMLVSLGVAEPPQAQVYMGSPNVQVWLDLHTGLYYCPGSELYGQTPGGKFTNQRDAQLDQFQPAARKNCE